MRSGVIFGADDLENDSRSHFRKKAPGTFFLLFLVTLLTVGCDKSPAEPFARDIEQAASWAASARYASELQEGGQVPASYLNDVRDTGTQGLQKLRPQMAKAKDIPQDLRVAALGLTDQLQSLLNADHIDAARLSDVEARLRELAQRARSS